MLKFLYFKKFFLVPNNESSFLIPMRECQCYPRLQHLSRQYIYIYVYWRFFFTISYISLYPVHARLIHNVLVIIRHGYEYIHILARFYYTQIRLHCVLYYENTFSFMLLLYHFQQEACVFIKEFYYGYCYEASSKENLTNHHIEFICNRLDCRL